MNVNPRNLVIFAVIALLMIWAVVTLLWSPAQRPASQDISFSQLLHDVDQARVRDVVIQGQEIRGTYKDGRAFSTYAPSTYTPSDPTFVQRLYSKDVVITARPPDEAPWFVSLLISWLPFIALIGVWIYLSRRIAGVGGKASSPWRRGAISNALLDDPKHWRDRADEARAVAERSTDPESRRWMLEIAAGYEHLALKAEQGLGGSEKSK